MNLLQYNRLKYLQLNKSKILKLLSLKLHIPLFAKKLFNLIFF